MSMRLEDQLAEMKEHLRIAQADLVKLTAEHAGRIQKAEDELEELRAASEKADDASSKLERSIEKKYKICHPKGDSWEWHPEFLERVAKVVGVHYKDRASVDPKNQRDSLYEQALHRAHGEMLRSIPEVIEARNKVGDISTQLSRARSKIWDVKRPLEEADRKVRTLKRSIDDMQHRIHVRDAEKQRAQALDPGTKKTAAQLDEAAKLARDRLRDLMEGRIKIPLEGK